jgi:hypothetical protein
MNKKKNVMGLLKSKSALFMTAMSCLTLTNRKLFQYQDAS